MEPRQAESTGEGLAAFALPAGWSSDYSMNVAGFKLVGYKPESGPGHIIFAVLPETSGTSIVQLERDIQGLADTHGYKWNRGRHDGCRA